MKIKTSELDGAPLDYAVAACLSSFTIGLMTKDMHTHPGVWNIDADMLYTPRRNITQAWPLIEKENMKLNIGSVVSSATIANEFWEELTETGPTAMVAAMRVFVRKHWGVEVDIPDEIVK